MDHFLKNNQLKYGVFLVLLLLFFVSASNVADLPVVGTEERLAKVDGVEVEIKVQSPSAQETPLQIVCLFEHMDEDIFPLPSALPKEFNGMVHVDEALGGLITDLRKSGRFEGKALETLLIIPPLNTIPAKKLLLIGVGDKKTFKPEIMRMVGGVGMKEALRLGVESYAHASDLKDAGLDASTAEVAGHVIKGALQAYQTQSYLKGRDASGPLSVTKITLLSGPAFFEASKEGIKKVVGDL